MIRRKRWSRRRGVRREADLRDRVRRLAQGAGEASHLLSPSLRANCSACPQDLSPRFGAPRSAARLSSFPATFNAYDLGHRSGPSLPGRCSVDSDKTAICGVFGRLADSTRESLLTREGLDSHQNRSICRYLSPLTDSNRRPPPYHSGSEEGSAGTRGHPRPRKPRKLEGSDAEE